MLTKYDIELIEIASLNSSSNNNDKPAVEEKTTDVASLEALFK
jgi:N utilization substance protein A